MVTIDDIRTEIMRHPLIEESDKSTSFRAVTFKTKGKGIIGIEKDMNHVTFALNEHDAQAALEDADLAAEAISKKGTLIGVRVDMHRLTATSLNTLVTRSAASV